MSGHTPGPWRVSLDHPKCRDTPERIFFIHGGDSMRGLEIASLYEAARQPTAEADAALIAAAPDLLAALRDIAEGCSFPETDVQRAIRDRARAAIAKATGEAVPA